MPINGVLSVYLLIGVAALSSRLFGVPLLIALYVLGPLLVAFALTMQFKQWRLDRQTPRSVAAAMTSQSDARYRLRLVCTPAQAHRIRTLSDDPFEPRIFNVPFALPRQRIARLSLYAPPSLVFLFAGRLFFPDGTRPAFGAAAPFVFMGLMMLAMLPLLWAWPAYIRLAPGRLDVMHYRLLGHGKSHITTYDLRRSRVLVDLKRNVAAIDTGTHPAHAGAAPDVLNIITIRDRVGLAKSIFEAARSTHPTPPLPDDALLG